MRRSSGKVWISVAKVSLDCWWCSNELHGLDARLICLSCVIYSSLVWIECRIYIIYTTRCGLDLVRSESYLTQIRQDHNNFVGSFPGKDPTSWYKSSMSSLSNQQAYSRHVLHPLLLPLEGGEGTCFSGWPTVDVYNLM